MVGTLNEMNLRFPNNNIKCFKKISTNLLQKSKLKEKKTLNLIMNQKRKIGLTWFD